MPSHKTELTELGTALGLVVDPGGLWPDSIESATVPGIAHEVWQPVVLPATEPGARDRDLLLVAIANGQAFRRSVLGGVAPCVVDWCGRDKTVWSSEVPRDLTVDDVYFIQAKHDSTCVLNKSPHSVFDGLLAETDTVWAKSWFDEVAPLEVRAYYDAVRQATLPAELPFDLDDVTKDHKALLKREMRSRDKAMPDEDARYADLCKAVSERTANHWLARLARATPGQRTRLFLRMLRIAGGPYWLLGATSDGPLQLAVTDTRGWRNRFDLRSFLAEAARVGQPQVNWRAEITHRDSGERVTVDGYCEVRWSHGKLQGNPECKVQVTTPLDRLPGYDPMG